MAINASWQSKIKKVSWLSHQSSLLVHLINQLDSCVNKHDLAYASCLGATLTCVDMLKSKQGHERGGGADQIGTIASSHTCTMCLWVTGEDVLY